MYDDKTIFQQLERFGAAFPWEKVEIMIKRAPEGTYEFVTYLAGDEHTGFTYAFGHGAGPEAAVDAIIKTAGDRDPNRAAQQKIAELEMQIERLKRRSFLLPPYRAQGQLGYGERPQEEGTPRPSSETIVDV